MKRGNPTGAAMPLCWSHAEYLSLVRSRHDGVCYDRIELAFQRYVAKPVPSRHEIWTMRHPLRRMPPGKTLRVILGAEADITWTSDNWAKTSQILCSYNEALNLWFVDLPAVGLASGMAVEFTFFWTEAQKWEGRNWQVKIQ
jgi:glucoamylase